jgi:small subunit ribosomal protein S14
MAKTSAIQKNKAREKLVAKQASTRAALKATIKDRSLSPEDRFVAVMELNELPKNGSKIRVRNRCEITGRARSVYRKFKMSRIALRDLASRGQIPGMTKSSW